MKKSSKGWQALISGITLSLILALVISCTPAPAPAPPPPAPAPVPPPTPKWEWPKSITTVSASTASGNYMTQLAALSEMERMTGMKVRIIPEDSLAVKARLLKQQAIDFFGDAHGSLATMCMMAYGEHATKTGGPFQARSVWLIYRSYVAFITRADSGIKTIYDIKPHHRLAAYTGAYTSLLACEALLKWIQVDAIIVPCATWGATQKAVMEGRADICPIVTTSPVAYESAAMPGGINVLALDTKKDPEGAKRFFEHALVRAPAVVTEGIEASIGVPSFTQPFAFHAHADLDPELVYHFVKWLAENQDAYKDKHPNCKYMSLDESMKFISISALPIHEGTIRYLKEVGRWTAEFDTANEEAMKLLTRYIEAYEAAIAEADKKKIKVSPTNEEWMALWESYKKDFPPIIARML